MKPNFPYHFIGESYHPGDYDRVPNLVPPHFHDFNS